MMRFVTRSNTGLTMIELLVCLSILAFTLGGVVAIFFAGSRQGQFAQQRTEAGRVGQAILDFADTPKDVGVLAWGRVTADGIVRTGSITNLTPGAADIVFTELPLVWEAQIDLHTIDGLQCKILVIRLAMDENGNDNLDADDPEVSRYYALMVDR